MFAFIDESCFPRSDDHSAYSVLLAACIRSEDIRYLARRVYQIKEDVFGGGADVEIKAKNFVIPKTLRPERSRNKEFTDRLFELIDGISMGVYAAIMERPDFVPYVDPDKLPKHYTFLLYRVDAHASAEGRMASVVFDGQDSKTDEDVSRRFYNLIFRGNALDRVMEMPLFVSSKIVPGIQIADIMAGVTRHYYNENLHRVAPQNPWQQWLKEKFDIIRSKTSDRYLATSGRKQFGLFVMDKRSFPKAP